MGTARCAKCGELFERGYNEKWKKLCLDCWIEQKNAGLTYSPSSGINYRDRYYELREQFSELEIKNAQLELALERSFVINVGRNFICDNLMHMISLCHPDRHENSYLSNEVTKCLLEIKERLPA